MLIVDNKKIAEDVKSLEKELREEFLKVKMGDVVKIRKMFDNKFSYCFISKMGNPQDKKQGKKLFALTNINSGYTWRIGTEELYSTFDRWFLNMEGTLSIDSLEIVKKPSLSVESISGEI